MTDWARLAEPFDASDIQQRPGRGGMTFDYVDARAVAQRLDDVVTPTGWEFTCSVIPGSDIVKGRLVIDGIAREDHGYPNSDSDDEPIKSATSDALKRCAVLFGIGRHLYSKHAPASTGRAAPPPARPVARTSTDVPDEPDWMEPIVGGVDIEDFCPDHDLAWVLKPGGVSKTTGKPYDPFWVCPSDERPFCKNKPSRQWQGRQAA
jgi:hypothetical protein